MTKLKSKQVPFLFFLLPYIHLTLAIDYLFHSIGGIFLFLLLTMLIGFYAKRTNQVPLLVLGNMVNLLLSCLLIFFKSPLVALYHSSSPFSVAIPLIFLFLVAQLIGIFWGYALHKESKLSISKEKDH